MLTRKRIQLGLIHVAVAMTLVPINSTLNRVMIKELAISATLVAVLASLPYLFSPIQVAIGSFSDRHPLWGRRRTPYIVLGLLLCVAGVVISPQVAFAMSRDLWSGLAVGLVAFGAWGMGFNFATVSYLSLASEISGEKGRSRTIAIMWFMMISSIIITAVLLSRLLETYTPDTLARSFQVVGGLALALGLLGLIRLEEPQSEVEPAKSEHYSWATLMQTILSNRQATLFFWYLTVLLAALLGQDVLLEPFGGEAFDLSVQATTRITSIWGAAVLASLLVAGTLEGRVSKRRVAWWGGVGALAGFGLIALSGVAGGLILFYLGVILLGIGTGMSTVSNLSLMLDMTTTANVGLFIGAWGMASALARMVGSVLSGAVRDLVSQASGDPVLGYVVVFAIMAALMLISILILGRIDTQAFRRQTEETSVIERAALATEV